jgi:hypothetical protein
VSSGWTRGSFGTLPAGPASGSPRRPSAGKAPCTTPGDDKRAFEQAVLSEADLLVTGDRDVTGMGTERPVRILTPRGFWELIRADPQPPS